MKKIAINGEFTVRRQTGQERFASEVIRELDSICDKDQFVLVVPEYSEPSFNLKNIEIIKFGKRKSILWEQIDFCRWSKGNKALTLNLCTIQPVFSPGIVCIHDISYKINPSFFKTIYGRTSAIWHKLNYFVATRKSPLIFTVTETSKKEIVDIYKVKSEKIVVVPNGWEHIIRCGEDPSVLRNNPQIQPNNYYISIGSLAPNKNLQWVIRAARFNPDDQFVIVGRASLSEYGVDTNDFKLNNIIMTGYVTDEGLKTLIKNSKALIFPSIYEGFGIPPLEALALGKKAIVAKCSCMPEIFTNYVYYLDPYNPEVPMNSLTNYDIEKPYTLLKKYCYANAAALILQAIRDLGEARR